ncbi:LptF/LptG family permease [Rhodoligotrophos defluvii]|uniref:LptF/LptG family permease n=1 Tax=Rhodoligotrophos defluvii TaxID=2561934 RepID=UPI0014856373|nr:LptF/LptG family permease [Rhodoligotrophos defluvii]
MGTLARMLTRMFTVRFAMILIGVSLFVVTLDVITYVNDILALKGATAWAVPYYGLLRLPTIMSSFIGISALLAALLLLTEISNSNELVAVWGTGVSQLRLIGMLTPIALIIGALSFGLNNYAIPMAAPTLHAWGIGDYGEKKLKVGEGDPIWMRSGNDILRAGTSNPQATVLRDVIIFRRDAKGILQEQIMAGSAELVDGRWELRDVTMYYQEDLPPNRLDRMIYSGLMRPAAAGSRSGDPEEMSARDLEYFIENAGFGIRPTQVYETWLMKRMTGIVTALLMIAIAVPLSVRFKRGGGLGAMFAIGVGLGFAFFIVDGLAVTLGELGMVPPWMAAWMPPLIFATLAGVMISRAEAL